MEEEEESLALDTSTPTVHATKGSSCVYRVKAIYAVATLSKKYHTNYCNISTICVDMQPQHFTTGGGRAPPMNFFWVFPQNISLKSFLYLKQHVEHR